MKLGARLVVGAVAVLGVATAVVVTSSRTTLRRTLQANLEEAMAEEASLLQDALRGPAGAWPAQVRRWATLRGHVLVVVDSSGRVLADSRTPVPQLDAPKEGPPPEVAAALGGRVGVATRSPLGEPRQLFVAVPGTPVVVVGRTLEALDAEVAATQAAILRRGLVAILFGAALAALLSRGITGPLRQLSGAARELPRGGEVRLPRSGIAEVDQLGQSLREAQQALGARFEELQQERAESGALVDAMVEGVLATDARGRVITANPAARQLLGYPGEAPLPELRALFRTKALRDVVDTALEGRAALDHEVELDGHTLLVNARPLPTGGVILVLHDLTDLRRLEDIRRDFVANVSHELKTPLTSISGYTETLLTDDPEPAVRAQFLRTILSNAQRMQRLVDDQLDLARIESGRWTPQPTEVDVATAARESWAARAAAAEAAGVWLEIETEPGAATVRIDPDALSQVFGNLFDNAIRYAPRGSAITCRAALSGDGACIAVEDHGPGIPSEHLPRLFERFYRVDPSRSREAGGTGLGLAIVKHLIEAHGGWVQAESTLGEGTTIRFWLPA